MCPDPSDFLGERNDFEQFYEEYRIRHYSKSSPVHFDFEYDHSSHRYKDTHTEAAFQAFQYAYSVGFDHGAEWSLKSPDITSQRKDEARYWLTL